jgi:hypothetical protein
MWRPTLGDVLVFRAAEAGIGALWRSLMFGTPPDRLFAVTIGVDSRETRHELEDHEPLQVIAARTSEPLKDTHLNPGETCYVAARDAEAVARSEAVALWQVAASRGPQPGKTEVALSILAGVIVAGLVWPDDRGPWRVQHAVVRTVRLPRAVGVAGPGVPGGGVPRSNLT